MAGFEYYFRILKNVSENIEIGHLGSNVADESCNFNNTKIDIIIQNRHLPKWPKFNFNFH